MRTSLSLLFVLGAFYASAQGVGIGVANPHASAMLEVASTEKGFLPPRMTQVQRDAIASPAAGLIIYNLTAHRAEVFNGTGWAAFADNNSAAVKRLVGGNGFERYSCIEPTSDGGYIIAGEGKAGGGGNMPANTFGSTVEHAGWLVKLDAAGNVQWQKYLGGLTTSFFYSIKQTTEGGYIAGGGTYNPNTGTLAGVTGYGDCDGWVVKLDADGNVQWQKLLGGSNTDYINSVCLATGGGYVLAMFTTSSNTGTLTSLVNGGGSDAVIIKLDLQGNTQWQQIYGGSGDEEAFRLAAAPDGGFVFTGQASSSNSGTLAGVTGNGGFDTWVVKINVTGVLQWQKLLGGSSSDAGYDLVVNADGSLLVAGNVQSPADGTLAGITTYGGNDGWLVKLTSAGATQWQKRLGGTSYDEFYSVSATSDGGYILAGLSQSSNTGTLTGITNNGGMDAWVAKVNATGDIGWQQLLGGTQAEMFRVLFAAPPRGTPGACIRQAPDGTYFLAGYSTSSNTGTLTGLSNYGSEDAWLLRLSANGNPY
jgi:hypothetical protein